MAFSPEIFDLTASKPDVRLPYGTDENQFLDLRLAKTADPHALAIVIHGGYWRAKYNLLYAGHLCAALAANGIATANLEYRRVGNPGGGWPGTFADVRTAMQFLTQNAQRYGFDLTRIAAIGHSAGAQLALCLAAREHAIHSAISLAGVIDLQKAYTLHLSNDAVVEYLGGNPIEIKDHYREADPMKLKIAARQWIVLGSEDADVPLLLSRNYAAAKEKAREHVQLVEIPGANHFDLLDPRTPAGKQVVSLVVDATKSSAFQKS